MKVVLEDLAKDSIDNIFYGNLRYSYKSAIEIDQNIHLLIDDIGYSPHSGRQIPEMSNKNFREIIYIKSKNSRYRIMYYISKRTDTIYIFNIISSKQDFYKNLKLHNYFNKYLKF